MLGTTEDITDSKASEEDLQHQKQSQETILNATPIKVSLQGNE